MKFQCYFHRVQTPADAVEIDADSLHQAAERFVESKLTQGVRWRWWQREVMVRNARTPKLRGRPDYQNKFRLFEVEQVITVKYYAKLKGTKVLL